MIITSLHCTAYLGSSRIFLIALVTASSVMVCLSRASPSPLSTILAALSGWSPNIGMASRGTLWYSDSSTPFIPQWETNKTVLG